MQRARKVTFYRLCCSGVTQYTPVPQTELPTSYGDEIYRCVRCSKLWRPPLPEVHDLAVYLDDGEELKEGARTVIAYQNMVLYSKYKKEKSA